jgi:amino acid adenylation domain-containing protein
MRFLLQHWVSRGAERQPEKIAIALGPKALTYAELEKQSNQLARLLIESGCQKGDRVCFLMPKTPMAIVSMIGILKAGCIHVPLDPSSPALRIRRIVEACDNRWILAAGPVVRLLCELRGELSDRISLGWLDDRAADFQVDWSLADLARMSSAPPSPQGSSGDPAHILFTSGSTGVPKGVVITHENVRHFVEWGVRHFSIGADERLSGHTPLHFDLSTFDVFGTFRAGAQLRLVPPEVALSPLALSEFIDREQLTQWFSVPSVLNYMFKFDVVRFKGFPLLRRVLWCGEVLPSPALAYWMKRLPHVRFTNLYGPTEATIASSFYDVPQAPFDERQPIPIGTACAGEALLILNQDLQPVPTGEVGDLYIAGAGLSQGYWRDPEKTAAAFLVDPRRNDPKLRIYRTGDLARSDANGLVYFVGRNDTQIKSRGYRIELGEIETALSSLPCLRESAVVAVDRGGFEGWLICCAYALQPGSDRNATHIRKQLERLLPSYMIPGRWMDLGALPKNANGKIDRPEVKRLFLNESRAEQSLSRTAVSQA